MQSFAVTKEGELFSWGYNDYFAPGHILNSDEKVYLPKVIYLKNVSSICSSKTNTHFLTNDGFIYFCGIKNNFQMYERTPKLLSGLSQIKVKLLHSSETNIDYESISLAEKENGVYILDSNKF